MGKHWLQTLLGVLLVLSAPAVVSASTIVVAKDGSGDYGVIQDAVYAAAEGDTIFIRAGEYTEHAPYTDAWGYTWDAYVAVNVTGLVFLGEDRDTVVIGPEEPAFDGFDPKGFLGDEFVSVTVENLTVRNVREGCSVPFAGAFEGVAMSGCYIGVLMRSLGGARVRECHFGDMEYGVFLGSGSRFSRIESCSFDSVGVAINVANNDDTAIDGCTITNVRGGIEFEQFSTGSIHATSINGADAYGVRATDGVDLVVEGVTIGPTQVGVYIVNDSHLIMSGSAVGLGSVNTVWLSGESTAEITGCDIEVSGPESVWMRTGGYISDPPKIIDMRNNYWGLPDSAAIADVIWDMNDDPEIKGIVEFMPFSATPLPTERKSVGSFKALFGGQ